MIGQEVVCIRRSYFDTPDVHPVKDEIYTIRSVTDYGGLRFEEVINTVRLQRHNNRYEEVSFHPDRFVPIQYNQSAIEALLEESLVEVLK